MSALSKICEDSYLELDREFQNNRPLNYWRIFEIN